MANKIAGTVPMSEDVLHKIDAGIWAIEIDEGKAPRLYANDTMLHLMGLKERLSPEEMYSAWFERVDKGSLDIVNDAVAQMTSGEHAEAQYPWHDPAGFIRIVRCGGVRNFGYEQGIRLEGTHQDVTKLVHLDDAKRRKEVQDLSFIIMTALSDDYTTLYYIDAESGEYKLISKDDRFNEQVNSRLIHGTDFYEDCVKSIDRVIYSEDRHRIEPLTSREKIEAAFGGQDSFTIEYRIEFDGKIVWFAVKTVRVKGLDGKTAYALGVRCLEDERKREIEHIRTALRSDGLRFIAEHDADPGLFMDWFGKRVIALIGCDRVIARRIDGSSVVIAREGIVEPDACCAGCPFSKTESEFFSSSEPLVITDCAKGLRGVKPNEGCRAKTVYARQVFISGELFGGFSVQYMKEPHVFQRNEAEILEAVAQELGDLIGRVEMKSAEIARLRAESSNKAKTEFLFNMSHDIRTPMNAILGYADIAQRHVDEPPRVSDSLDKIRTSGAHLLSLINDILEMSRIESGTLEINEQPTDLIKMLDTAASMSRALAIKKDMEFKAVFDGIENRYVYADELHLNQVLINLISNAVKYTPNGGHVEFTAEQLGPASRGKAKYRMSVKDDGIGMSEEFQKHLFESFAREKNSTVSGQEGTGLGLSIVKRIVDLIAGKITVQSKQGVGSTFTVEFELRVMKPEEIDRFNVETDRTAAFNNTALEGKRVLLVEDNEMNMDIGTELLEEAGFEVETASDGAVALDKVKQKGIGYYDFVLMDIQMPVMNGYEATAAIRALKDGEKVPIIALSANAFKEDMEKSIASGMNAHIAKPIDMKTLIETLKTILK